jgi:protein-S-isoprenylcysteine O-methyltransferase Ste14
MRHFRKVKTNIRPFKEADKLVTTGPFSWLRNPRPLAVRPEELRSDPACGGA